MERLIKLLEQTLVQWKTHIEENEQMDIMDINHLEALEWKKINLELQTLKANPVENRVSFAEPNVGDKYCRIVIKYDKIICDELIWGNDPIRDAQAIITGNIYLDKDTVENLCKKAEELYSKYEARSN